MNPKWDEAPSWANWVAMDSDGSWWWFADEPIKHDDIDWRSEERFERASLTKWDNSKERRP